MGQGQRPEPLLHGGRQRPRQRLVLARARTSPRRDELRGGPARASASRTRDRCLVLAERRPLVLDRRRDFEDVAKRLAVLADEPLEPCDRSFRAAEAVAGPPPAPRGRRGAASASARTCSKMPGSCALGPSTRPRGSRGGRPASEATAALGPSPSSSIAPRAPRAAPPSIPGSPRARPTSASSASISPAPSGATASISSHSWSSSSSRRARSSADPPSRSLASSRRSRCSARSARTTASSMPTRRGRGARAPHRAGGAPGARAGRAARTATSARSASIWADDGPAVDARARSRPPAGARGRDAPRRRHRRRRRPPRGSARVGSRTGSDRSPPPRTRWSASTSSVLPAPVSPVRTLSPSAKSIDHVFDRADVADLQRLEHRSVWPSRRLARSLPPDAVPLAHDDLERGSGADTRTVIPGSRWAMSGRRPPAPPNGPEARSAPRSRRTEDDAAIDGEVRRHRREQRARRGPVRPTGPPAERL